MAVASVALAGDDDAPTSFLSDIPRAAGRQWLRLSIICAPLLVLGIMALHAVFGMFDQDALMAAAASGKEPSTPLSIQLIELLAKHPVDWILGVVIIGIWCLLSAADALDVRRSILPGGMRELVAPRLVPVAVLAVASAIVLGPVLNEVFSRVGRELAPVAEAQAGSAQGFGVLVVIIASLVTATFVSVVAIAWVSLLDADTDRWPLLETVGDPGPEATPVAAVPAPVATATAHDVYVALGPGTPIGWWVYARAHQQVMVQVQTDVGAAPVVMYCDAAGTWAYANPGSISGASDVPIAVDGWWYIALAQVESTAQNCGVRLMLPEGAQLQQQPAA